MGDDTSRIGGLTLTAFLVVVVIGGGNFVAVRISNQELDPFWGAGLRFSLAALIFAAIALTMRLSWPRGAQLRLVALYGILSFTLSYALMYWALVRVSAGLAAVLLAVVPLITPLLAVIHRMEPLNRRSLAGAGIALLGIVIMTVGPEGLLIPATGLAAIALAALTVAESVIVSKKVSLGHPIVTNAVGMPVGALGLGVISLVANETWALPQKTSVVWSVLYLVTVGSVGLFALFLFVIRRWTSSATSYAFVLFPVVAILLEALILDEPLSIRSVLGALVVMAGVWFGVMAPGARSSAPSREGADTTAA